MERRGKADMSHWVEAARLDELADGVVYRLVLGSVRLAVVRSGSKVHAVGDRCTHLGVSLSRGGPAREGRLACWLHGSRFDLRTGQALEPPATTALPVHDVLIELDEAGVAVVLVDLEPRPEIVANSLTPNS